MGFIRNSGRHLASSGFKLSSLCLAIVVSLLVVVGSASSVKGTLDKSGAYASLASVVGEQAQQSDSEDGQVNQALGQPETQQAIKESLSPQFIKSSTEQVVDGTYNWLEGKSSQPDFKVDLTPAIDNIKNKSADAAVAKAQKLPPCTLQQLRSLNPNSINVFDLPCLPPGIDMAAQRQQLINTINAHSGDNEFLSNPVLTADRLNQAKDGNSGKNVFQTAHALPTSFQWLQRSPVIFGLLALVCAAAVIFLHRTKRLGVRSLAFGLVINGVLLLLISLLTSYLFSHYITKPGGPLHLDDSGPQQVATQIANAFQSGISKQLLTFGIVYVVVGLVAFIALKVLKPKSGSPAGSLTALSSTAAPAGQTLDRRVPTEHNINNSRTHKL